MSLSKCKLTVSLVSELLFLSFFTSFSTPVCIAVKDCSSQDAAKLWNVMIDIINWIYLRISIQYNKFWKYLSSCIEFVWSRKFVFKDKSKCFIYLSSFADWCIVTIYFVVWCRTLTIWYLSCLQVAAYYRNKELINAKIFKWISIIFWLVIQCISFDLLKIENLGLYAVGCPPPVVWEKSTGWSSSS